MREKADERNEYREKVERYVERIDLLQPSLEYTLRQVLGMEDEEMVGTARNNFGVLVTDSLVLAPGYWNPSDGRFLSVDKLKHRRVDKLVDYMSDGYEVDLKKPENINGHEYLDNLSKALTAISRVDEDFSPVSDNSPTHGRKFDSEGFNYKNKVALLDACYDRWVRED